VLRLLGMSLGLSGVAGAIGPTIRARDTFPCCRIPCGRRRNPTHSGERVGSQKLAPQAPRSRGRDHWRTNSRRNMARPATRSGDAIRAWMSGDRRGIQSRGRSRSAADRRGRDPRRCSDSEGPERGSALRHANCGGDSDFTSLMNLRSSKTPT
jgi:hypothetical protein